MNVETEAVAKDIKTIQEDQARKKKTFVSNFDKPEIGNIYSEKINANQENVVNKTGKTVPKKNISNLTKTD